MSTPRCDNCGHLLGEHCTVHLIPCCPGKCPPGHVLVLDPVFEAEIEAIEDHLRHPAGKRRPR